VTAISAMFDAPGPVARIRHRAGTAVVVVVVIAGIFFVVYRLAATGQFDARVWEWIEYRKIQLALVDGLLATAKAFALGAVLAIALGGLFALGRLSDHAPVRLVSTAVVELFRAVPLVVLLFLFYYGLPAIGATVTTYTAVVAGLMLNNGSVLAEVFRSGVRALPKGQQEAAYAIGMRKSQVMRLVLIPQAVHAMMPTIVSQLVVLLKDSALGFLILYPELLYQARLLGSDGALGRPLLPVAMVVAAIYITLCLLLSAAARYLQRRLR
jgi:glutamate transport system permease protein